MRLGPGHPLAILLAGLVSCAAPPPLRDRLTILLHDDVRTLNPNEEVELVTDSVLSNVYEPLVTLDENLTPRTMLAESWEHPRPDQWRFHLRKGVRFQDGTPLTAAHVRDLLATTQQTAALEASQFLSQVKEIVLVDDHTVDIITHEPRAILSDLPFLYIAKANSQGTFPPFAGTGPFRIKDWKPGQRVVLERNADYWGPRPSVREASFLPVPDAATRLQKLRTGEADLITRVPPEMSGATPGVRFARQSGLGVFYLGYDVRPEPDNPMRDVRVRRAFHLAIDRRRMVDEILKGSGSVSTQPVAPAVFGYNPDLPPPTLDPDRARQLLAQAGHPRGFTLRLDYPLNQEATAQILKENLEAIGVRLELNGMHRDSVYDFVKTGKSRFFLVGWDCASGVASEFYEFCLHTPASGYGALNYGHYSNPTLDRIAETNAAILDQRKRQRLLQQAAAIVMDELPVLPLFVADDLYGARSELVFKPRADGRILLLDMGFGPENAGGPTEEMR
jgi:peptide/nickel transport system substrate-binding protein